MRMTFSLQHWIIYNAVEIQQPFNLLVPPVDIDIIVLEWVIEASISYILFFIFQAGK